MQCLYRNVHVGPQALVRSYAQLEPRVTVFVPTYNRSHLLRASIESILAQTYDDFRLEISDNASTDDSPRSSPLLRPAIDLVRQPENLGMLGHDNCSWRAWRRSTP